MLVAVLRLREKSGTKCGLILLCDVVEGGKVVRRAVRLVRVTAGVVAVLESRLPLFRRRPVVWRGEVL
jgi:hypothetical protein